MADFRIIPSIEQLRQRDAIQPLEARFGHEAVVAALRDASAALRSQIVVGGPAVPADPEGAAQVIERGTAERLSQRFRGSLRPVLNATGVILHTNLGRAPLADAALERIRTLGGYTNLEYDLREGRRGSRSDHAEALLAALTGAEAATVANNNAAATLLMLAALATGREVLISRGELVEIGGGFRVPDVMAQSGAILREVGTTNRTRASDYAAAITDRTALILRVHRSNFRIEGFTARPSLEELVALGHEFHVPVVEDLGSGAMVPLAGEPTVGASVAAGVEVVCFSGDKLLGGPQAGILVGRAAALARIKRHPLMRAFRVDKLTYAALEATLLEYAAGRAQETVPVVRMLSLTPADVGRRARALADRLAAGGWTTEVIDGASTVGGGSAPGVVLPTRLLALSRAPWSPDALDAKLRALEVPVVGRIEHDRFVLDLRTVAPADDERLATILLALA